MPASPFAPSLIARPLSAVVSGFPSLPFPTPMVPNNHGPGASPAGVCILYCANTEGEAARSESAVVNRDGGRRIGARNGVESWMLCKDLNRRESSRFEQFALANQR